MAALIRTVLRGRCKVHLFGVEAYTSHKGGDELFALFSEFRPRVVLMESFAAPDADVSTGGMIPYRDHLNSTGLPWALAAMAANQELRQSWTCEAVGVLAALHAGAEIRFADRYHSLSFDRIIARRSLDQVRRDVVMATEGVAQKLEQTKGAVDIPQNGLCPFFPELWSERHAVMAQVTKLAAQEAQQIQDDALQTHHVALVVGAEHIDHVVPLLQDETSVPMPMGGFGGGLENHLEVPDDPATFEEQLEKRCAMAALLGATRAFPQSLVLPPPEDLVQEAQPVVRRAYPRYHRAIAERLAGAGLNSVHSSMEDVLSRHQQATHSLSQLYELCNQLAEAPSPS